MKLFKKIGLESDQISILLSAFSAAYGVGLISLLALPLMVGSTMESLGLNEASVGLLYSTEFLAAALSSIVVAPFTGKIKRRNLALIGAFVAIVGNLASAQWGSYEWLLVFRPLTGVGAGLALACGNATVANARHPARMTGLMNILFVVLLIIVMLVLPLLSEAYGLEGVFLGLATVILVMTILVRQMPQGANTDKMSSCNDKGVNMGIFSVAGIAVLAAFFMFSLRDTMAWAFAERIGIETGHSTAEVGRLLSLQAVIALIGPIIVTLVGFKFGVRGPLVAGLLFAGLVTFTVFLSASAHHLFGIAILCWSAGYFFALAYLTAHAATLDVSGRIVAASGSALVLGMAVGPVVSGGLITYGGYALGAWVTAVLVFAMIIAVMASLKKPKAAEV